jgi:translation elongation factor EF-1alpha
MTEQRGAPEERPIGQVTHYFSKVGVAAIDLSDKLAVGQRIHIRGHTTDFITSVESMQIEHEQVSQAGPGASIGIKVTEKVRPGDMVYSAP